jgi:hypothetical protein
LLHCQLLSAQLLQVHLPGRRICRRRSNGLLLLGGLLLLSGLLLLLLPFIGRFALFGLPIVQVLLPLSGLLPGQLVLLSLLFL